MSHKAQISGFNMQTRERTGQVVKVDFNPSSYTISAGNSFDINTDSRSGEKPFWFVFLKKNPASMTVELLFNSYKPEEAQEKQEDVRKHFTILRNHMKVKPEIHSPEMLLFSWGCTHFAGVLTRIEENYTMFAENGTPVRAKVTITISGTAISEMAVKPVESPDRTKLYTTCQKDTLWAIAHREYGSFTEWRSIAKANGLHNPRILPSAKRLVVPALTNEG